MFAPLLTVGVAVLLTGAPPPAFAPEILELPPEVRAEMTGVSWRPGCPVPLEDLRLVRLSHWGYDGAVHPGELVVHREVALEVVEIFRELFDARFPIERMERVERYSGDDDRSMAANNTSGFNCRRMESNPKAFSRHSYGKAIDLNPRTNPFVIKGEVKPPAGRAHLDRAEAPGLIRAGDVCHRAFTRRGWRWGGAWRTLKDYQHFERR